jgi:adenylate kinase
VFRICVLYVDEEISVQRQLSRGRMIREHNIEVKKTGQGVFWDERVTDNDESVSIPYYKK